MRILRFILSISVCGFVLVGLHGVSPLKAVQGGGQDAGMRPATGDAVSDALRGLSWRSIGPANMGGRVTAVQGVPGNPKIFWVAGADGGVWKTTDAGTTFQGVFEREWSYSVGALALAPSDHNVLWLGAGEGDPRNSVGYGNGVYRSTDGGMTWTHLGLDDSERIKRIRVHPQNPDIALVCALGKEWGDNETRGVFKTTDGGQSWRKVLYINQETGCSDLDLDPPQRVRRHVDLSPQTLAVRRRRQGDSTVCKPRHGRDLEKNRNHAP